MSRRTGLLVAGVGLILVLLSLHGYYARGLIMRPDFGLYTQGGLGLFPSPLGRLAGVLGADAFVMLSALAAGAVPLALALLAGKRFSSATPGLVALLCLFSPATLYLTYAGIDGVALVPLLLALAGIRPLLLFLTAALLHLSLVPFAVLFLPRSTTAGRAALLFLACPVTAALLMTPYSGVVYGLFHPDALGALALGLAVGLLLSLPGLIFAPPSRLWLLALLVGVAECGAQHHLQARYLLPAAFVALAGARWPLGALWWSRGAGVSPAQAGVNLAGTYARIRGVPASTGRHVRPRAVTAALDVRPTPDTRAMPVTKTKGRRQTGPSKPADAIPARRGYTSG